MFSATFCGIAKLKLLIEVLFLSSGLDVVLRKLS